MEFVLPEQFDLKRVRHADDEVTTDFTGDATPGG